MCQIAYQIGQIEGKSLGQIECQNICQKIARIFARLNATTCQSLGQIECEKNSRKYAR